MPWWTADVARLAVGGEASRATTFRAAQALSTSRGLKTVQLATHPLPVQELTVAARVEMDGQRLTDFDVQFIVELLSAATYQGKAHTIRGLSLGYNGLTEKGASMLARALGSGSMRLLQLNLRGNKVGSDGAVALVEAMMKGG